MAGHRAGLALQPGLLQPLPGGKADPASRSKGILLEADHAGLLQLGRERPGSECRARFIPRSKRGLGREAAGLQNDTFESI